MTKNIILLIFMSWPFGLGSMEQSTFINTEESSLNALRLPLRSHETVSLARLQPAALERLVLYLEASSTHHDILNEKLLSDIINQLSLLLEDIDATYCVESEELLANIIHKIAYTIIKHDPVPATLANRMSAIRSPGLQKRIAEEILDQLEQYIPWKISKKILHFKKIVCGAVHFPNNTKFLTVSKKTSFTAHPLSLMPQRITIPLIHIHDTATRQRIDEINLPYDKGELSAIAFATNEKQIAFGMNTNCFCIYDLNTHHFSEHSLPSENQSIHSLAWSPDNSLLAIGAEKIYLFDVVHRTIIGTLEGYEGEMSAIAWSPDKKILAGASLRGIHLWKVFTGEHLISLPQHKAVMLSWSSDKKKIAAISDEGTIHLWDTRTYQQREAVSLSLPREHCSLITYRPLIETFGFTDDDRKIVMQLSNGELYTWNQPHVEKFIRIVQKTGQSSKKCIIS